MKAPFQYVVVHRSAAALPGVLACQAIHAATECLRGATPGQPVVSGDTHVGVLVAEKSADLEQLAEKLAEAGIHHVLIREPDPPYNGAATAVGVEPQDRDAVRPFMAQFKALR